MDAATAQRALQAVQAAIQAGRLADAKSTLRPLRKAMPREKAVLYVSARLARAEGRPADAAKLLEKALRASPGEAALWAEYASMLDDAGRPREAVRAYDRALALEPRLLDAEVDRAIIRVTKLDEPGARDDLQRLAKAHPDHLRAWRNLAMVERSAFDAGGAIEACEHVLRTAPGDASALAQRAFAGFDAGEESAHWFVRARRADPANAALALKHAAALHAEGQSQEADRLLDELLAAQPFMVEALRTQAQLRWEAGLEGPPLEGFARATDRPACPPEVWREYARLAERHSGAEAALAIVERAKGALGDTRETTLMEARAACEAEDFAEREAIFAAIARRKEPEAELLRCRWLARMHRFDEVGRLGERLLKAGLGRDVLPYLSIAWRGMADERWRWLERDGDLVATLDVGERIRDMGRLADYLRSIHKARRQPLEQSLRGGTQTDGMLFARTAPEIVELEAAIRDAVADYLSGLPEADSRHPLLSLPRTMKRFTGAWSVRLEGSGFHVAHHHNLGDVSSAFYVALPEAMGEGDDRDDGWLAVGEPPREFGLDWEPLRLVRPREGLLALFPSWQWHGTRPFSEGERLTVAFDVALG